jgi:hypothetical protein
MSVKSDQLHERAMAFYPSGEQEVVTLLPFFAATGEIRRVMIVGRGQDAVRFFSPGEVRLRIGWRGPIRCDTTRMQLRVVEYEDLEPLVGLWHYDPWWLLTSGEVMDGQRKKMLMESNCAGRFADELGIVTRLYYARNLSRVQALMRVKGEEAGCTRFRSKWLPAREPATVEDCRQRGADRSWQLAPFWEASPKRAESRELRGTHHESRVVGAFRSL